MWVYTQRIVLGLFQMRQMSLIYLEMKSDSAQDNLVSSYMHYVVYMGMFLGTDIRLS